MLWDDIYPSTPHPKPPGDPEMLRLIAYDIADPRRLRRIAETCADYGVRVQKSLFECWLESTAFERLWADLQTHLDLDADCLVCYTLDKAATHRRRTAGRHMACTQPRHTLII